MKSNSTGLCRFGLALVLAVSVSMARADQKNETLQRALSKVPTAEVPARAAEIVAQAKAAERDAVAADVVKIVIKSRPTLSVATVGMISAKCPDGCWNGLFLASQCVFARPRIPFPVISALATGL